ncbi:MAG: VOC family protein [Candidatus Manganitrophaceae bacterium]
MAKMISDSWVMAGARDIKKSIAFYAKLGLKPAINQPYYVELNLPGGTVLGLHSIGKERRAKRPVAKRMSDGGWGIMLRVKNIEKVVAELKRKRILCSKVETAPGGADFTSLHDPDGNRLILVEMKEA